LPINSNGFVEGDREELSVRGGGGNVSSLVEGELFEGCSTAVLSIVEGGERGLEGFRREGRV
jgi:hypothetical protein